MCVYYIWLLIYVCVCVLVMNYAAAAVPISDTSTRVIIARRTAYCSVVLFAGEKSRDT